MSSDKICVTNADRSFVFIGFRNGRTTFIMCVLTVVMYSCNATETNGGSADNQSHSHVINSSIVAIVLVQFLMTRFMFVCDDSKLVIVSCNNDGYKSCYYF